MAGAVDPALLRKARETALLSRYVRGGKVSAAELAEIQHLLPSVEGAEVAALIPFVGAATKPAHYQKPLRDYVPTFDRHLRVIKGWVAVGKKALDGNGNPAPDLPPLDDPPAMAAWWERHMKQRPPAKLLSLAVAARTQPLSSEAREKSEPVDVSKIDIDNLDSLRQARRYLAAVDQKLSAAYAAGDEAQIRRWQKPFNEALDSARKAEAAQREAAKAAGDVIPKAELFSDLSQLLEVLRQMRSTMRRRICARLADLGPELLERIGVAIDLERESEDGVLRQLKQFRSIEEVHFQLEAQPAN